VSVRHTTTLFFSYPQEPRLCVSRFPFLFCEKIKGKNKFILEEPIPVIKTVRIETHSSLFGGTFFLQPDRPCYFSEPQQEKQKTKIRHTEPRRWDGHQRLWLFLLPVGRPRSLLEGACLQSHV
jgi:hypothetical protein